MGKMLAIAGTGQESRGQRGPHAPAAVEAQRVSPSTVLPHRSFCAMATPCARTSVQGLGSGSRGIHKAPSPASVRSTGGFPFPSDPWRCGPQEHTSINPCLQTSLLESTLLEANQSKGMSWQYKKCLRINMKKANYLMEVWAKDINLTIHWKESTNNFHPEC